MPSIVTHHVFAKEVLKKSNLSLNEDIYFIFAQSFDNLFYYKFLTPWKGKEIRSFGESAQDMNINLYFENILEEVKKKKNKDLLSYLYGSICHYILDSTCHPYIIYYTGYRKKNKKYRGLHEKMEINLDAYILKEKEHKDLKKEKLADILLPNIKLKEDLKQSLDSIFYNTFKIKNGGSIYEEGFRTGHFLVKYFVTDTLGFKKCIYKIKDKIMKNSNRKYEYLSFHVTKIEDIYLNLEHDTWCYPTDNTKIHKESFMEIYEIALEKSVFIIQKIESYLQNKITKKEVLEIIGNNSYVTGLDCNRKEELQYFKF